MTLMFDIARPCKRGLKYLLNMDSMSLFLV